MMKRFRRALTLVLAFCLCQGVMPVGALSAAETGNPFLTDLKFQSGLSSGHIPKANLPARYDSRDLGLITPIADQGRDTTCWAFAATSAFETSLIKRGIANNSINLSEDHAKAATLKAYADSVNALGHKVSSSAGGGNMFDMVAYWARGQGPVVEGDGYPAGYVAGDAQRTRSQVESASARYSLSDMNILYGNLTSRLASDAREYLFSLIKQNVMDCGTVFTAIYGNAPAGSSYIYAPEYKDVDHAVAIIGWDDSISRNLFTPAAKRDGAFIVKNSWGTVYGGRPVGDNGYYYVSYDDATVGTLSCVVVASAKTSGEQIYQNDSFPASKQFSHSYIAAQFKAQSFERLTKFGMFTANDNQRYEVYLMNGRMKSSSTIAFSAPDKTLIASGTVKSPGYHIIDIPGNVFVNGDFVLAVRYVHSGDSKYNNMTCFLESNGPDGKYAESFGSSDGHSWIDLERMYGSGFATGDVCLKAYAVPAAEVKAKSVSLSKTSAQLGVGERLSVKATVAPSNTSNKTVAVTSGNNKIARWDAAKRQVAAVKTGRATLTFKCGSISKKLTVTVKKAPAKVTLNKKTATVRRGATLKLNASLSAGSASQLTWTTSSKSVCSVSATGSVKALKKGKSTIRVKTFNGKSATCTIKVV